MSLMIIEIIIFFTIYMYNIFFINYFIKVLDLKIKKKIVITIVPISISIISMILIIKQFFSPLSYTITFLLYMITFKLCFEESIKNIYAICISTIFQLIINKDIILGIITLLLGNSMNNTIKSYKLFVISFIITNIIMTVLTIKFEKICDLDMTKNLLINKNKISGITTSLVIVLLNSNYAYYYSGDVNTTILMMLIKRICINFCFYSVLKMRMKSIKWVEEELLYKSAILQLESRSEMIEKREEYSNILKMYNHDFKNVLYNVKDAIESGKIEKAKSIILELDDQVENIIDLNKNFSNNLLVNSILNRVKKECDNNKINFDSECYISEELSISELDLVKIFNNLASNALEACNRQNDTESKWIHFKSYIKENSMIIYQNNSFDGKIKIKNDKLMTSKKNKKRHGIGVESIKYIVKKYNGISIIKIDDDKKEFNFLIKIPLRLK